MKDTENLIRYIESLALVGQSISETGMLGDVVYADVFEVIAELTGMLRAATETEAA